jgi:hypothetical protein
VSTGSSATPWSSTDSTPRRKNHAPRSKKPFDLV